MKNLWYNIKLFWNNKMADVTTDDVVRTCDYCGEKHTSTGKFYVKDSGMTICWGCMKKAFDKVLKENT